MFQGPWQIQLLGELRLERDGIAVDPPANQAAELTAQLAESVGRQISRDQLVEELWPDADTDQARNRFRVLLTAVRRLLEPEGTPNGDVLFSNRSVIGLSAKTCRVDVEQFMRHAQLAARAATSEERMAHYRAADNLYRGEFLRGRTSPWILARRAHYARVQALAQFRYAALLEEAGDAAAALEQINRSIEADPLREAPRRRALRMLVEAGDIGAALAQFEEFEALLKRSVGLSPTREFQAWIRELKGGAQPRKMASDLKLPTARPPDVILQTLEPAQRELFSALGAFSGGFDLTAAGSVCGATPQDLQKLASLGLITKVPGSDGSRYSMPDPMRALGWANLDRQDRERLQDRHAAYFSRMMTDATTLQLQSGIQNFSRLRTELDNFRASIARSVQVGDAETACILTLSLSGIWIYAGLQKEGREMAIAIRNGVELTPLQEAYLDATEGILASFQDNPQEGRAFIRKALPTLQEAGQLRQVAGVQWLLGYCAYLSGEFEESLAVATQIASEDGPYRARGDAYRNNLIGMSLLELGRLNEAEPILKDVRRQWQELGDLPYADYCLLNLARATWKRGELDAAWKEYRQLTGAFSDWDDPRGLAYSVEGLGRVAADLGKFQWAARLLGAAEGLRDSMGARRDFADDQAYECAVDKACLGLGSAYGPLWESGYALAPERIGELLSGL